MAQAHVPVERCEFSASLSRSIWALFEEVSPGNVRSRFSMSAILLAHEHHSAVVSLVSGQRFASATTLLRPMIEGLATAAWSLYVAKIERLEQLVSGNGKLPDLNVMLEQVEARRELKGREGFRDLMRGNGKIFHDFTHGEVTQLKRRFGVGPSATTYELRENYGTLMIADLVILVSAGVAAAISDSSRMDDFVDHSIGLVIQHSRATFPEVSLPEWTGWNPLPRLS